MTSNTALAIVGGGLAGAKAAEAARDTGFDRPILLIGDEEAPPYERPPLSKAVLRGEAEADSARVHAADYYTDHGIDVLSGRVTAIDGTRRQLELASGARIGFDRAILATGARPRRLSTPGADLAGVHYLRTVDESLRLRDAIRGANRIAVIGAGWIGSEVTASARLMGTDVVLIDPSPVPLQRVLGAAVGEVFRELHADHDVGLRLGLGVTELRGGSTVEQVVLADGTVEDVDLVVAGIGVEPRSDIASSTGGIVVDNGIVVDEHLETPIDGIYAAGDVANAWHPHYGRHLRIEHWANALNQGLMAGRNAAGAHQSYNRLPYFYSDQYDLGLEYVGHGDANDSVAVRGDLSAREFVAVWHRDGVPTAAMNVNVWDVVDDLKALVTAREPLDLARFEDPDVPLTSLTTSADPADHSA